MVAGNVGRHKARRAAAPRERDHGAVLEHQLTQMYDRSRRLELELRGLGPSEQPEGPKLLSLLENIRVVEQERSLQFPASETNPLVVA